MNITVFNASLLAGWLLVLLGGLVMDPAKGLIAAGLLLIIVVFVVVRIAGLYQPNQEEKAE